MSSIDKYIEDIAFRLDKSVKVEKIGNTIYGYKGGEQIFAIADRYGYANSDDERIVREGIRRYDEREALKEAEKEEMRRAREEALRKAREEAERIRREQQEAQRQMARSNLREEIRQKKEELSRSRSIALKNEETVLQSMQIRRDAVANLISLSSRFDFSQYENRNLVDGERQSQQASSYTSFCDQALSKIQAIDSASTDSLTTAEYNSLINDVRAVSIPVAQMGNIAYENLSFVEEIEEVKKRVKTILPAIQELERLSSQDNEVGIIATEALDAIKSESIGNAEDFVEISQIATGRLARISRVAADAEIASRISEISFMRGILSDGGETSVIFATSTYTSTDRRSEIVSNALQAIEGYRALITADYTTCTKERINEVTQRLESIISGSEKSEEVLDETERFISELRGYENADRNHRAEYEEYLTTVEALKEYGIDLAEIEAYSPNSYTQQRRILANKLSQARREFEYSRLLITEMHVKNIMEEMGFDLFSSAEDVGGNVRETLYTRRGYDGVLWQVIVCADGSVNRSIIGVNKGETETDIEYIKEVAAEMEQNEDPRKFLTKLCDATQSRSSCKVTSAVEYDSEDADEVIRANGFHYLEGDALRSYEKFVEVPQANQTHRQGRQVRVVSGHKICNSQTQLSRRAETLQRSRAMNHAH